HVHFETAIDLLEAAGQQHPAARVLARVGGLHVGWGDPAAGVERMERAYAVLRHDRPDADLARLAAELGRTYSLTGRAREAQEPLDLAIGYAEGHALPDPLPAALISKSFMLTWLGRRAEPLALQRHALTIAQDSGLTQQTLRAHFNLADTLVRSDRFREAEEHAASALALARRMG